MKENSIETYEAPKVEIIEVEVEKGFATSGGGARKQFVLCLRAGKLCPYSRRWDRPVWF